MAIGPAPEVRNVAFLGLVNANHIAAEKSRRRFDDIEQVSVRKLNRRHGTKILEGGEAPFKLVRGLFRDMSDGHIHAAVQLVDTGATCGSGQRG